MAGVREGGGGGEGVRMKGGGGGGEGGVRVAVRVRPFNGRERQMESRLVVEMAGETQVKKELTSPRFVSLRFYVALFLKVSLLPAVADAPGASSLAGDKHKPHNFAFDHAYW